MHDGTLTATSEGPGRGATFTVELPRSADARPKPSDPPAPKPLHRPLRLLVVDDHEATSSVMARLLSARGYTVSVASSVKTALAVLDETPVDVLISDLGLPDGTGCELLEKVRERQHIPGIALSGYGTSADIQLSRKAGFRAHLTKPIDIDELDHQIQALRAE
jgi:CheY-like chemotaxis protein